MSITLCVSAQDLDVDDLQDLTRELCRGLIDEAGVNASLAKHGGEAGTKGDISLLGQIIISAIGGGGVAVALVNVLRAYVQRKPSLQFELRKKNGDSIKIKADDLRAGDTNVLVATIAKAIGDVQ